MAATIVCTKDQPTTKVYYGEQVEVTPYIGTNGHEEFGLGALVGRKGSVPHRIFWGLFTSNALIQAWRGMQLLHAAPGMVEAMCCHCYTLAKEDVLEIDKSMFDRQAHLFGGVEAYQKVRAEVLALFPSDDELAAMLSVMSAHEIEIDEREIDEARASLAPAEEILVRLKKAHQERMQREGQRTRASARHIRVLASSRVGKALLSRLF